MKKILISFLAIISTVIVGKILTMPSTNNVVIAQEKNTPVYAKWGKLAMEKVMEKYPTAEIIDYLHVGRTVGDKTTKEQFKLWLRGADQKEFGVYVTITFDNHTEKVVKIEYKVTDR